MASARCGGLGLGEDLIVSHGGMGDGDSGNEDIFRCVNNEKETKEVPMHEQRQTSFGPVQLLLPPAIVVRLQRRCHLRRSETKNGDDGNEERIVRSNKKLEKKKKNIPMCE